MIMTKILIVDDDVQITNLLEKLLSLDGFEPTVVNDSTKALEVAVSTKPDFFILDLMMPQPNGFELCSMLRGDENFKNTPILIITASDDYDSKAIAYAAGANDYITKPFDHDDLPLRIRSMLDKAE
jgi:DNA-binding response OmpR family regulator